MKMVEFVGLSGPIKFDASGLRTQFVLSLMELQMPGLVSFSDNWGLKIKVLDQTVLRQFAIQKTEDLWWFG